MTMNKEEKDVFDKFVYELERNVVGKRVVDVSFDRLKDKVDLVLETGTILTLTGYGECCAYGELTFAGRLNTSENVITSLRVEVEDSFSNSFKIFLLSSFNNMEQETIRVDGSITEGTGYYSYGWDLSVTLA